ncbi:hypothetical protein [Mesonia sp. K4-1]|uniref:hypothetical protein n=1 Tax=Mesonia sp. K4-1 TaxID=2602760 RepID=UPI0011C993A9|nr:hypothetical protein [Mesonia sp. K4-1]TXK74674.1 hypothetical protein FT986_11290 [Mesonia sp. K4-1]
MRNEIDISLILSGVRALLGHVPNTLRFVSVELKDEIIHWKCVFDSKANEKDIELLSQAAGELISDFPKYELNEISEIVDFPAKGIPLKNLIYYRHEHNYYEN